MVDPTSAHWIVTAISPTEKSMYNLHVIKSVPNPYLIRLQLLSWIKVRYAILFCGNNNDWSITNYLFHWAGVSEYFHYSLIRFLFHTFKPISCLQTGLYFTFNWFVLFVCAFDSCWGLRLYIYLDLQNFMLRFATFYWNKHSSSPIEKQLCYCFILRFVWFWMATYNQLWMVF